MMGTTAATLELRRSPREPFCLCMHDLCFEEMTRGVGLEQNAHVGHTITQNLRPTEHSEVSASLRNAAIVGSTLVIGEAVRTS